MNRLTIIIAIIFISITSLAQEYRAQRAGNVISGGNSHLLCFQEDSSGIAYGNPVDDDFCKVGYRAARNSFVNSEWNDSVSCFPADKYGLPYGYVVSDVFCRSSPPYISGPATVPPNEKMSSNSKPKAEVQSLYERQRDFIFSIHGVVGAGVARCEEKSKIIHLLVPLKDRPKSVYLWCILITTESEEAALRVKHKLPKDQSIEGVFITPVNQNCMSIDDNC